MIMNHRKLISDTVTINITAFCEPYCDPRDNFSGYCPNLCFYNCPSSCMTSYLPPPHVPITTIHHSRTRRNLHLSIIITLSFIGLACFLYCLFNLYKHYKSTRRPFQEQETRDLDEFLDEDQGPVLDHPIWYIRTVGLEASVIDSISVCKYKRWEGLVEGTDCSVCLSEFEDDETLRILPKCNHAFHVSCIDTWLRSHTNCPLCRAPIVSVLNLEQNFVEENQVMESEETESSRDRRRINENEETNEVQLIKRSVSMDSLAIANVNLEELNKMNTDIVPKGDDLNHGLMISMGSSSFKRSLQKGVVLMKRSSSCSGNFLFPGYNRGMNSALPL